ncbi:unnamed protein product, partial [Mesorhabditis spiculigera]
MKAAVVCFLALLAVAAASEPVPSGKPPAPGATSAAPAPAASKAPVPASPAPASKAPAPSAAAPAATSAKPAGRRSVENFCLVYVGSAATVNLCHFFWGVPCAIWELNDSFEAGSLVFGFVANASVCYMYTARIILSVNRLLSIAFDGRYYRYLGKDRTTSQLPFLIPTICVIPMLIPDCHMTFLTEPLLVFDSAGGDCATEYVYWLTIPAGYGTIATTALCELIVLILLVKRQASIPGRQSQHGLRRQFRFAGQLVTHTLSSMLLTVLSNIAYGGGEDIFSTFLLFTASWQASCLCACSLYIVFHANSLRRPRIVQLSRVTGSILGYPAERSAFTVTS